MPSDMRDELVDTGSGALVARWDAQTYAGQQAVVDTETVIDSIPPGSFKLDEKTWVRLEPRFPCGAPSAFEGHYGHDDIADLCRPVYTEVDHA